MLLNAQLAAKAILGAYAHGVLTRGVAMQQLGLDWYSDFLQKMNSHRIKRTSASPGDMLVMQQSADEVLGLWEPPAARP